MLDLTIYSVPRRWVQNPIEGGKPGRHFINESALVGLQGIELVAAQHTGGAPDR